jgi:hypothetical protein
MIIRETNLFEFEKLIRAHDNSTKLFGVIFSNQDCHACQTFKENMISIQDSDICDAIELYTIEISDPHDIPLFASPNIPAFYLFTKGLRASEGIGDPGYEGILEFLRKFIQNHIAIHSPVKKQE